MNIKENLYYAANKLSNAQINTATLEARILLQHVIGKSLEYILARPENELTLQEQNVFEQLLTRRLLLEPIAYITGTKEFYGRNFVVSDKVLIPRPDTELLIDVILKEVDNNISVEVLELGTGSGCIATSLLLEMPNIYLTATDISNDAIMVARQNAINHNVLGRSRIINSDWFKSLEKHPFDIIVSNPPYISPDDTLNMSIETLQHEPYLALFAENNGLASYHIIAKEAKNFLKPQGKLFLEIGYNQSNDVTEIFYNSGYVVKKVYKDLAGHDRVLVII
jgi:release factor glutamine methyltransferase